MNHRMNFKWKRWFLSFAFFIFATVCANKPVHAEEYESLDRIRDYEVQVDVRDDGSCDLTYHIEWEVLDSESEGPLTWIKVGIPNCFANDFKALSNNIDRIYYYSEGDEDFVRLDLDRSYKSGEVLYLDFTFHQMNLFDMYSEDVEYDFTPGWFPDTPVDKLVVRWSAKNVKKVSDGAELVDDYYVWTDTEGGYYVTMDVCVTYDIDQYDYLAGNVSEEDYDDFEYAGLYYIDKKVLSILLLVLPLGGAAVICLLMLVFKSLRSDGYDEKRGLGSLYYQGQQSNYGRGRYYGGSGCACDCACACACAGGGRAGCSRKDFYGTKLYTKDIYKALEQQKRRIPF